jgi:prepilin-type processing-associated H-X9-DG protein
VVIILVLVLLFALLAPALQSPRIPSRRMQCLNNLKNVSLAAHNDAMKRGNALPPLVREDEGWPIELLEELDNAPIQRAFRAGNVEEIRKGDPWLEVYTCPADTNHHEEPFGLSYAANAGFGNFQVDATTGRIKPRGGHTPQMDWTGDGNADPAISLSTGIFWKFGEQEPSVTLDGISNADGAGNTLMFAENLQAGNWLSTDVVDIGFVIDRKLLGLPNLDSKAGVLELPRTARLNGFRPNANPKLPVGMAPRPSSNHEGTINVAYCDGRAVSINDDIDPQVYARLLTWNGQEYGEQPLNEEDLR